MFAIVEISGEQYKIDNTTKSLRVAYMSGAEAGQKVAIDRVLLTQDKGGKVALNGKASIAASVAGHSRGEKVIVFKKKRRKGYRVTNGHTQRYTELNIESFAI
jgi:large subunit ribosomal protein L21